MGRRTILFFLFLLALALAAHAVVVGPKVYEQKDLGDISLNEFIYSLSADCTAATVSVTVMNETGKPLRDVHTYLNYVEFSSQLMSTAETDQEGVALHKLPGNVQLMRGLFTLVMEKYRYRNKEIHFDLSPCFASSQKQNTTPPAPKPQNTTPTTPPKNNTTPKPPTQNQTNNGSGGQGNAQNNSSAGGSNATENGGQISIPGLNFKITSRVCPAAAFIAALSCIIFFEERPLKPAGSTIRPHGHRFARNRVKAHSMRSFEKYSQSR